MNLTGDTLGLPEGEAPMRWAIFLPRRNTDYI